MFVSPLIVSIVSHMLHTYKFIARVYGICFGASQASNFTTDIGKCVRIPVNLKLLSGHMPPLSFHLSRPCRAIMVASSHVGVLTLH